MVKMALLSQTCRLLFRAEVCRADTLSRAARAHPGRRLWKPNNHCKHELLITTREKKNNNHYPDMTLHCRLASHPLTAPKFPSLNLVCAQGLCFATAQAGAGSTKRPSCQEKLTILMHSFPSIHFLSYSVLKQQKKQTKPGS